MLLHYNKKDERRWIRMSEQMNQQIVVNRLKKERILKMMNIEDIEDIDDKSETIPMMIDDGTSMKVTEINNPNEKACGIGTIQTDDETARYYQNLRESVVY